MWVSWQKDFFLINLGKLTSVLEVTYLLVCTLPTFKTDLMTTSIWHRIWDMLLICFLFYQPNYRKFKIFSLWNGSSEGIFGYSLFIFVMLVLLCNRYKFHL